MPIGGKPVDITLDIPRVACPSCAVVRQTPVDFADPRRSYTRSFKRYALQLSRLMTIQDVARHLQVSWDTIKDIQKRDNKIKIMQRQAYGFRDQEFFKLKILALHEAKYALLG